jgi:2-keto-3-deoxy-6-phosphogluconate aldolase
VNKDAVLARVRTERIIGVVRAHLGEALIPCARALEAGGIRSLELSSTTPDAVRILAQAHAAIPDFHFGLGTVLDAETARAGILAGAAFIVTPAVRPDVITLCRRYNVAVISGAYSPDEVAAAHFAGADAIKVYPGNLFGPAYLASIRDRVHGATLIPIGGVTPATTGEFFRCGATAVFAGASLVSEESVATAAWDVVTARAQVFAHAAAATPFAR